MPQYKLWYHVTSNNTFAKVLFSVIRQLKPPPARILDLTYGEGYHTRLLKNVVLSSGEKYELITNDVSEDSPAQFHFDLRFPPDWVRRRKFDLIYVDPPYADDFYIRSKGSQISKNKETYRRGFSDLYSILMALDNYHKYQPDGGILLIKLQDISKDNKYIPSHLIAYNCIRHYVPLRPIVYVYTCNVLSNYGFLFPFIKK